MSSIPDPAFSSVAPGQPQLFGRVYRPRLRVHWSDRLAHAILLVAGLWLGLRPPANVPTACAFLISLACTVGLVAAWTTWISTTLLWTVSGEGVARIAPVLVMAGSGQLVPLAVFPEPLRTVASWLPFAGMVDIPFSIWTGALAPDRWVPMIGRQVGWTLLLVLLGRWMLSHGLRRLTVQGG